MRKFYALCFLLSLQCFTAGAQQKLSEQAEFYIVTCGPYQQELYSAFGHSAIHLFDPERGINDVYNYGVFDFDQPNFYLNFARGKNNFKLAIQDYRSFRDFYVYFNRFIHQQRLNFTQEQKQKFYEYLEWNALPENCTYAYDYFYDNCATRIRDVLKKVFGDALQYDTSYIKTTYTIRELTDLYLARQPWGDLGIDICLGLPMDKKASPYEYMFLPDYIESSVNHATLSGQPLVAENSSSFVALYKNEPDSLFQPWTVFGVLLALVLGISYRDWRRKRLSNWLDVVLFSVTGWVGVLLILLWTVTDHKAAANNFNLLWALPTHAMIVFFLKGENRKWTTVYFSATSLLMAGLLLLWPWLPQQLNVFLIPVVMALLLRSGLISFLRRNRVATNG